MNTKIGLISFFLIVLPIVLWAQKPNSTVINSVLHGKVLDSQTQTPLEGVTIVIKGTTNQEQTDAKGSFTLRTGQKLPYILNISLDGYHTLQVLATSPSITIRLSPLATPSLSDVVVIGYGTQKRKDLTGAISSVSGDELSKVPVQNVASALAGRLAGVQVTTPDGTPGADVSIVVRGGTSITQSNEPLYVIDGVPQTNGLDVLDPQDIASIEVLKDASAASIYGARGANGVILVTTKRPKEGRTVITYDNYLSSKKVTKILPVLNAYQYTLLQYERSLGDATDFNKFISNYGTFSQLDSLYSGNPGINWQDEVFGNAVTSQYHKIGISGGSKQTQFSLFYSTNDDKGVMVNSGAKKQVARLSINHTANTNLKVSGTASYTDQLIYGVGTGEGNTYFNQLQNILTYRPTYGIKGSDQDLINLEEDPYLDDNSGNTLQNPLINAVSQQRNIYNKSLYLNGTIDYKIINHLSYRGIVGSRNFFIRNNQFNDSRSVSAKRSGGPNGSIANTDRYSWNYSNVLTYSNTFNKIHRLDFLVGQEQQYLKTRYVLTTLNGFPTENLGLDDLSQATTVVDASNTEDERLVSFFTRANYAFDDRYLLTATLRADGSSKFGPDNKYGYFPSVALAWRVIQESFLKSNKIISDLKLRLSIGTSGNNRIDNYSSLALLESGSYPLNNVNTVTVGSNNLPNPNLKWEQVLSRNIGLDIGLWGQRIQLTTEWYKYKTSNLLLNAQVPEFSGYSNMLINVGSTRNTGLEFTLNTVNIRNNNFQWTTNFNVAFNRNKVLGLTSGNSFMYASSNWGVLTENDYIVQVGQPLGQIYGYKSNGLYQTDDFDYNATSQTYTLKAGIPFDPNNQPQPGYLKLVDVNGDSTINSDDRTVIGNANPKYIGGINNTFSYKRFDLGIFLNWSVGGDIYNANKLYNSQTYLDYRNTLAYIADRWISIDAAGGRVKDPATLNALNKGKTIPVYNGSGTALRLYDQMVEDGSFLRISNISLGYSLPPSILSKIKLQSFRIYATVNNLHTFTSYSGYDPEVSARNSTRLTPGVDFGGYPRSRSFVAGVNISF